MNSLIYRLCAGFFLILVLSAGSALPGPAVPDGNVQVSQAAADISEISRQFRSETPVNVVFETDGFDLSLEARRRLDVQAGWLLRHPQVRIRVYGHSVRAKNTAYNMAMGLRRAQTVVKYLSRKGIAPHRLEAMVSLDDARPASGDAGGGVSGQQTTSRVIGVPIVEVSS